MLGEKPGGEVVLGMPLHPVDVTGAHGDVSVDREIVSETRQQRPLRAGRDQVPLQNVSAWDSARDPNRLRSVEGTLKPGSQLL